MPYRPLSNRDFGFRSTLGPRVSIQARFWLEWGCSDLPRSPGLRLGLGLWLGLGLRLGLEIERDGSADEILQGRLIDLVAFVDVDGAPDIAFEAGVE
jgi:hypothetical protein